MAHVEGPARRFTREDAVALTTGRSNWGRWGDDDQLGTLNLITPEKRVEAARLVRTGRSLSLSRPYPKDPAGNNPKPAIHYMDLTPKGGGGMAFDYYGISYHGWASTHIDALCHIWDERGMYNGRVPSEVIDTKGAQFGDVEVMRDGIVTRGVLLDVPRFRGEPFVTVDRPVHGWELEEICEAQGVQVTPGDALLVYSGREEWQRSTGQMWGTPHEGAGRPGLHASCLEFLRDHDCAVLVWDMMDLDPEDLGMLWPVHGAISAFGLTLVDNALLEGLAEACRAESRSDFMFVASPLRVAGGTGSPANPLAIL